MRRVNVNMHPKDGYFFTEADGTRVFGKSWKDVIARVVAHRARVGQAPGDPEREVHEQGCTRNPNLCYDDESPAAVVTRKAERRITVKGMVLKWFMAVRERLRLNDLKYVSPAEAAARTAICIGCPKNVDYPGGCSSCKAAVKESRAAILGRRPVNARLNACSVLGEDTACSVHLDDHRVPNGALPGHCWRKAGL